MFELTKEGNPPFRGVGGCFWPFYSLLFLMIFMASCTTSGEKKQEKIKAPFQLMTIDPGHFHAALVQKKELPWVDSTVHIYAPGGPDLDLHLARIDGFNSRSDNPTNWKSKVHTGSDFFDQMIKEKPGNIAVFAGNNQKKTEYIHAVVQANLNVLSDKPMAINKEDFQLLEKTFNLAETKGLTVYDLMTERYEITNMLQKELSHIEVIFGTLEKGTADDPAVTKESVHHFFKYVSGSVLTRPPWFFDVNQEGDGIVDVTTHLVDLIQWACYPGEVIDYENDVEINSAKRWTTDLSLSQFSEVTKTDSFPEYLTGALKNDSLLGVYSNGEINYKLKDVHAKVSVTWAYKAPEGGGDTHFSIMKGSKANLIIRQGQDQGFTPTLYIEPSEQSEEYKEAVVSAFQSVTDKYSGVTLKEIENGWIVDVPESYHVGHEAHFTQVMKKFLEYMKNDNMPDWEVPNTITKYFITTTALELAKEAQ